MRGVELPTGIESIPAQSRSYWAFQYQLGRQVIVPALRRRGAFQPGYTVAEIGSGEGGVLMAFIAEGATAALGTDIDSPRLMLGRQIATALNWPVTFVEHNILTDSIPEAWHGRYDLVLLRDTLEHLESPETALLQIARLLRPGGYLYISFPPYYSPFGGHQHLLRTFWGKLPYMHLLPNPLFQRLTARGQEPGRSEVRRLRHIRLSFRRFLRAVQVTGYRVLFQEHYLLRPAFRFRLGLPLPVIMLTWPCRQLPELFQFICTEASYLLQWPHPASALPQIPKASS